MAPVWSLPRHPVVALLALVALAAALPAAYAEILVLGELRAGEGQDWLVDAAAFESVDGHTYLLAVSRSGTAQIINVTDPHNPTLAASVRIGPDDSWFRDVDVLRPPGGRIYAVVAGDDTRILDVTDPTGPALVDGTRNGSVTASALGPAWGIEILERPDGRVHALVAGGDGRLRTVDVTDPAHLSVLGDPPGLGPGLPASVGATFSGPGDGRTYALYASPMVGVLVVDVADPLRPVLVSAVRYDDDRWSDDPFSVFGITPPSSSDVLISDGYAAGLRHPGEVAVFRPPDGRTYAMVANNGFTSTVNGSDPRSTPTGMLFLDVTDPDSPVPAGAVRNGEGGFDFGSHIRDIVVLDASGGRVHAVVAGGQDAAILDVTDPARPVTAARIQDGEGGFDAINLVFGMAVVGTPGGRTHLAMAGDEGIQVVDVTDPRAPTAAGSIPNEEVGLVDPVVFESGDGRTYALGVGGDGIHVVDVTDPARPVPAARIQDGEGGFDTLDEARQVEVFRTTGGRTYGMAGGDDGLQVVDVTDPAAPVAAGSLRDGEGGFDAGWITGMAAFQPPGGRDYVLVADHHTGVHVVDVTGPDAPTLAGGLRAGVDGFELLGGAHGIEVFDAGGRPYALMTGDRGIHTIDMSRPGEPRVAGTLKDGEGYSQLTAYDAVVFEAPGGPYALVADYTAGLHVIDLADPHEPVHVVSVPVGSEGGLLLVPGYPISTVASPDGRTYALAAGTAGIQVVDVTDPRAPALVDVLDLELSPWYVTVFWRDGGRAHALAGDADTMLVLDVTYPYAPVPVGAVAEGYAARGGTVYAPEGGRALALAGSGYHTILVADLADPRAPAVLGIIPAENDRPGDVVAAGSPDGRAYAMWIGASGDILAADVTEPRAVAAPTISDDMGLAPGSAMDLFRPHDGRTYMLAGSGDTIRIIDVTYPSGPAHVGSIRDNLGGFYHLGDIRDISVVYGDDRVLALAGSGDGVQVLDVTDPYHPAPAGGLRAGAGGLDMDGVHGTAALLSDGRVLALAAGGDGRTVILDITSPEMPAPAGAIPVWGGGSATDVSMFEDSGGRIYALLAGADSVRIVDITDPGAPVQVVALDGFAVSGIATFEDSGGRLHALLAGEGGVQVIYLDDPARYYAGTQP